MESIIKYASIEEAVTAIEIIYEEEDPRELMLSQVFSSNNMIKAISFGCMKETDRVLVMTNYVEAFACIISYIYLPDRIMIPVSSFLPQRSSIWEDILQLLKGYQYTKPEFLSTEQASLEGINRVFDVAVVGRIRSYISQNDNVRSRFYLELGDDYELFETNLREVSEAVKEEGVIILLAKPGWILKAWNVLESLTLQLDYFNYNLYVDSDRGPNTFVWLRLIKCTHEYNQEQNKRNILTLMRDNSIDRLYAHRNNLIFPYTELQSSNAEAYIDLSQNYEYMQYFFTTDTTKKLSQLCGSYTACLVTPSVAQCAYHEGKNIVLFERDNRFREKGGLKYIKYDLCKGLPKLLYTRYLYKFDKVICDPPFNIRLDLLAKDIVELLRKDNNSIAYIIFPDKGKASLVSAMKMCGMYLINDLNQIKIEYARPPKIVRLHGIDAIQLYKFAFAL